ncbi:uncharacterized protein LOC9657608 [Selaginella moellendorffii]|uniref:uncharacterized protein LOC9657608 n=1 Tax=Selaginella moellendorffii TaxID=88036 RepID=UPI000D1CB4D9|nr:uncharacterized protein LOC9657608 [Selaginella moellendorffii]|eukprot:XP_024541597.1 uncharacterized protein LOC9657608 [Selaginella moellendorffii]
MGVLLFQQCNAGAAAAPVNRSKDWRPGTLSCARNQRLITVCCSNGEKSGVAIKVEGDSTPKKRPVLSRAPPRSFGVKDEELVPGKVLTGSVKAIMTFGAFIDLDARFDGLLHISKISDRFVQNVEDVLTVGQQVQVEIESVDLPKRRIQLKRHAVIAQGSKVSSSGTAQVEGTGALAAVPKDTSTGTQAARIRASTNGAPVAGKNGAAASQDDGTNSSRIAGTSTKQPGTRFQSRSSSSTTREEISKEPSSSPLPRLSSRIPPPKTSYQKGQVVSGVVKNYTRRGCFVQLPGNQEGFLHANEIESSREQEPTPVENLVKVGQELKVKVLRIIDGRINLTMKEEVDLKKIKELNENVFATNPFELAFRKNPVIRGYLKETGRLQGSEHGNEERRTRGVEENSSEEKGLRVEWSTIPEDVVELTIPHLDMS